MNTRFYVVENGTNPERLVDAKSQAAAERHVAAPIRARLATQRDIARLIGAGVEVEAAGGPESFTNPPADDAE